MSHVAGAAGGAVGLLLGVAIAICLYARAGAHRQKLSDAEGDEMMTANPLFSISPPASLGGASSGLQRSLTVRAPRLTQPLLTLLSYFHGLHLHRAISGVQDLVDASSFKILVRMICHVHAPWVLRQATAGCIEVVMAWCTGHGRVFTTHRATSFHCGRRPALARTRTIPPPFQLPPPPAT